MPNDAWNITSGQLRHPIQIQKNVTSPDGQGGTTANWTTIANGSVWAAIIPASATEQFKYAQLQMRTTHKIRIRYLAGLDASMRVLYGTRVFNIRAIINLQERNKVLDLIAEEGVPG